MTGGSGAARRLQRVLRANQVGLWGSVLVLVVLRLTLTADTGLTVGVLMLTAGGVALLVAEYWVRRGRLALVAVLIIVANWIPAVGVAYATPFITPVGLFALLVPVVLLLDYLSPRVLTRVAMGTVLATATLAGVGEWRRTQATAAMTAPTITIPLVVLFVFGVVGVLSAGLVQHTRRLTEQAEALRLSRSRLASAADDARRGIERDLHDGAQQRLSTLSVRLGRARRLLPGEPTQAEQVLTAAQEELHEAIKELRDLAHGIYPMLLEQRGLAQALAAAARRATRPCSVEAPGLARYPAAVENAVYFCCLEAIHNADRHSGATAITLRLRHDDDALAFTVSDDGSGFDALAVTSRGLTGMVDRIRAAGGTLSIDSTPGVGTVVAGRLPAVVLPPS